MNTYKRNFISTALIFIFTLLLITMARAISGKNPYMYTLINLVGFGLLGYGRLQI